jgi:pimeloyl-ACP methyl ester carboxylesterase
MHNVTSSDGTRIAYDRFGKGPAIILVDGALCSRNFGPMPKLAPLLAQHFTVITYDRRGRGDSGDTAPYDIEREVEDLAALIREVGESASVFGISSGAVLALEAARRGLSIRKMALFEPPFIINNSRPTTESEWVHINQAIASSRRSDAVKLFLKAVGAPGFFVAIMRWLPLWKKLKSVAHTLPYDGALVKEFQKGEELPTNRWSEIKIPTLVIDGGKSPQWIRHAAHSLAGVLPNARYRTLERQTHNLSAVVVAPVLMDFFEGLT